MELTSKPSAHAGIRNLIVTSTSLVPMISKFMFPLQGQSVVCLSWISPLAMGTVNVADVYKCTFISALCVLVASLDHRYPPR